MVYLSIKNVKVSLNSPYSSFFVNDLDWHTLKEVIVQAHPLFLVFLAVTGFVSIDYLNFSF